MKKKSMPKDLAQWVIDNRYPKSEMEKVSDLEMYHRIKDEIQALKQANAGLRQSLDRLLSATMMLLGSVPVRDMDETIAEAKAALNVGLSKHNKQ